MSNVNSEQVMSKIRAEISDDTVAPDEPLDNGCLFHREIDVAEIMRKIKHEAMFDRLLPDSADCSRNAENEISRRLEDICGEVERINSFIENTRILAEENMHPGRVIPVCASRPAIIRKLFTLIKRCVRKATHFLMLDQIAYNQKMDACVKALSESQEQVLRLADVVGLLTAEQKKQLTLQEEAYHVELQKMAAHYDLSLQGLRQKYDGSLQKLQQKHDEAMQELLAQRQMVQELEHAFAKKFSIYTKDCERTEENLIQLSKKIEDIETSFGKETALRQDQYKELFDSVAAERADLRRWQEDRDTKIQAMARDIIRTKWAFSDYKDDMLAPVSEVVTCGICGYSGETLELEKKLTSCIFDGGKITRYVCPDCGAIFGPTKVNTLTKKAFDDDYTVHYTGYHEGDSTEKELRTFMRLEPSKDGIYLNYGCGSWSHTMQELHNRGYQVYGYEPYSCDIANPYIISDRTVLSKMRFNGIFSNDVLEHFSDPVEELRFMKSLLATPDAQMAHCTGCFDYKNEYTRFHLFFFTGKSLHVICDRVGLNLLEISDAESLIGEKDFHCRTFEMKEKEIDYLPMACVNRFADFVEAGICLQPEGICFGPYITMPKGRYSLNVSLATPKYEKTTELRITSQSGKRLLEKINLRSGTNQLEFQLDEVEEQVEFVIENRCDENLILEKLSLSGSH